MTNWVSKTHPILRLSNSAKTHKNAHYICLGVLNTESYDFSMTYDIIPPTMEQRFGGGRLTLEEEARLQQGC
jgi:hypothetical protein